MKKLIITNILEAVRVLKDGGIVIFPTDTAFGIGCRIDNHDAVDRLFRLRKRPITQAMPVLVSSESMALPYLLSPSDVVRHLMKKYWPGGLTIISQSETTRVYSPIRAGTNAVGLRMPNHKEMLEIITAVGVPIVGPSANFHGEKTPFRFEDIDSNLIKLADFVLEGVCYSTIASTVVDCTTDPYTIIRQGAINLP